MDPLVIFIGDTHGFMDDFIKQKEVIEKFNPKFVLAERLEDISLNTKKKYENLLKKRRISNMTSFHEVEKLVNFCYNKNINLIGIDLRSFGFDKKIQKKINLRRNLTDKERRLIENTLKKREHKHLKLISKYLKISSKPIVVIMGSWHLRENSHILNAIENYRIIFPCDKEGNILIEPSVNKNEVYYCEKNKNDFEN